MHASAEANASLLPFRLRPGVVGAMLRFYDEIRRQSQSVARFEELLGESFGGGDEDGDRGTERLLRQTSFLAASFREYERRLGAIGASDEHALRARLVSETLSPSVHRVVVTVADWIAEPAGLFVADFDLLSRLPHLAAIDIVCTERVLGSGFHERLHGWWPGLDEIDAFELTDQKPPPRPRLVTPPGSGVDRPWFTYRDREEELLAVARRLVTDEAKGSRPAVDRTGVVFKRPLPYLYLAPDAFNSVGLAFQSPEALPLATEPTAAALDLVLDCAESGFTRTSLSAILRSPHFRVAGLADRPSRESIAAFDRSLSDLRYLGDRSRLERLADSDATALLNPAARPALEAAILIARELAPLLEAAPASAQIRLLAGFFRRHLSPEMSGREARARGLVYEILDGLAEAHAAHHDPDWIIADLASAIREWIGEQTFASERSAVGVQLLDDQAARYGEFEDLVLVGLIETEWPERPRRNIFYSAPALKALGWPSERDRRSGADARFLDLLESAASTVRLSTFTLDDEALVARSAQLDEISRARLSSVVSEEADSPDVFPDETLTAEPPRLAGFDDPLSAEWLEMRIDRTPATDPAFHGTVGPQAPRPWSVSALETYLECPFKFFARHVLRLREEPDDEETMDPRREGQFVHQVFEAFFKEWQAAGQGTITSTNLDAARGMFTAVVDRLLVNVPIAEAALERTRLLGSPAAAGLGEAVLRMEAERRVPVEERLLEHEFSGTFRVQSQDGERAVALKGKADRLDLLTDGTFRLIDYKLGWPPNRARALQLPIYALCAEQRLAGRGGRTWKLGEAVYLAFKGPRRVVPLFTTASDREEVLSAAEQRLTATIDAIGRGEFPPTPDDVFRCESCDFASVCRKDYVGDV
jgi:RecB family exonuclease